MLLFAFVSSNTTFAQEHTHTPSCMSPESLAHSTLIQNLTQEVLSSTSFQSRFEQTYQFSASTFLELNSYFVSQIEFDIINATDGNSNLQFSDVENLYFSRIAYYHSQDELLFEIPMDHNVSRVYYGKNVYNPIDRGATDIPKTASCLNAGFEENSWNGWQTFCATATNGYNVLNVTAYVPPAACNSPANTPTQHVLWTAGNDPIGGFPRVFNGGVSAMIGNGPQANNPQHQAAVLRKQFVVDPNNTIITYNYAAVLDNRGGHTAAQQPFFNVRLLVNGTSVPCAAYSATAGDGQQGWVNAGNVFYRDWTTIAVPLEAYIGQTVELEFSVSDCFVGGGSHYGYAYIDVSCNNLEVEQFCEGTSTTLSAPTDGISSYLWNTGATTSSITITTPGVYTVDVVPYGSICPVTITYNATIFPAPVSSFDLNYNSICVGGDVDLVATSTVAAGGNITGYAWNFGDGITTTQGIGALTGVAQTTGTFNAPNHTYTSVGNYNISLTTYTDDGCYHTTTMPISVIQGPEATIGGNTVICENETAPVVTFTGSQTPPPFTFSYTLNGGAVQTVTSTTTTATVPAPTTPGTYTYNLTYVSSSSSAMCEQAQTGTVTVVVNPLPSATITQDAVVCQNDQSPTITFTGMNGTSDYQFTYTLNGGANQTISSTNGSDATVSVPTNTAGTFSYNLVSVQDITTGCITNYTAGMHAATVVVNPMPNATIASDAVVCQNATAPVVTFTGSNSSTNYTFTYNLNGGGTQTATSDLGSNNATLSVLTNIPGTYAYQLTNVADPATGCNFDLNQTVTITVNPLPAATISQSAVVCQEDQDPIVTFTGSQGTSTYQFTFSLNGGTNQTINSVGTTNAATISVPTTTAGNFTYQLIEVMDQATGCLVNYGSDGDSVTIVVNPKPTGNLTGSTTVCQNDLAPIITFTGTNSSTNYTFTYILNGGTTQTITSAAGSNQATIAVPTTIAGTYNYQLVNISDPTTGCNSTVDETVSILVNPLPAATIYGTTTLCQNEANPTVDFIGTNGTSDYTFTYSINGGPNLTISSSNSSTASITIPTAIDSVYVFTLISVSDVATGCSQNQSGQATITINPVPTATISGTIDVCKDAPAPVVTFTGTNSSSNYVFSYQHNNGPVQTITSVAGTNQATLTQATTIAGLYEYQLIGVQDGTTLCNSILNETITIDVKPLPIASISPAVEACHNDSLPLEITFTGSDGDAPFTFDYTVNGIANQIISTGNTATITIPTTTVGTNNFVITNIQEGSVLGCQQTQNVISHTTVHPLPIVFAGNPITVCANVPVILTGSGAVTYVWDNNVTNGIPFIPVDTATYTVIGTDANGCENTDSTIVNVVPIPQMDFSAVNTYGCSPVIPTFTNHSTGNLTNCTWSLGNGQTMQSCDSISAVFNYPGCFDVTLSVSTPEGCSNSMTIQNLVCVEANPIAAFHPDPAVLSTYDWESTMVNESSGASFYHWNFGDGTGPSSLHSPTHAFPNNEGGFYNVTLIATSAAGCVDTAYATIEVKDELIFYVPNTFTPDGDQYNEVFKPIFETGYDPQGYTLYIFDRWGELIFESHDTDIGWGGRYGIDSKICQDGTYNWAISIKKKKSSEVVKFTGHVNLIR